MSLTRRNVTPKMLAANRANALLSTGPRSEQGKRNVAQHWVRHGIFSTPTKGGMRELGESCEKYEKQREALFLSFAPEDGFEEMLLEDMVQLHWRWQRLMRAETGLVTSHQRRYEIDQEIEKLKRTAVAGGAATLGVIKHLGYAGLTDSVEKYEHMIRALRDLQDAVSIAGFDPSNEVFLDIVYGKMFPLAGLDLKMAFEAAKKRGEPGGPCVSSDAAEKRKEFVAAVDRVIAVYERLKELCRAKNCETTEAMKDAQLVSPAEELRMILLYESRLERQFRRKLRQLMGWRRAKRGTFAAQEHDLGPLESNAVEVANVRLLESSAESPHRSPWKGKRGGAKRTK